MGIDCPKCNTENTPDSEFCKKCATPLPSSKKIAVTKTLEKPAEELTRGTTLVSRYEIIEELGKGGMGRVYRVHDTEINEQVALKLLKPEIAADEKIIERFRNELKIARKVSHKRVCRMYDIGKEEEKYFITMEYVEGEDLKSLIRKKGKLPKNEVLKLAMQICEGLAEAHELGIVHRDLKPQNIMIDKKGNAKIMDFGIARSVEAPGVTQTGVMIGTPDYISPEQAEGDEADQRSDIYALGVILYEMVTGSVPFRGDTALSVALKHKAQLPKEPRKLNPEVSEQLNRLILICMEKDRERRYQRAEELLSDLRNLEEGFPLGTKMRPRREIFIFALIRKKLFIPALILVLGIVVVALWQFLPQKDQSFVSSGKPSLAVMYFKNNTGNENFDNYRELLADLLTEDLSQSKFIYVLPKERTYSILSKMDLLEAQNYTSEQLARIADLAVVDHLILGTYAKVGDRFRISTNLHEARSGERLATETIEDVEDEVFSMVDTLTERLKSHLGFSQQNIANDIDSSLRDITTSSVEAYRYYNEAQQHIKRSDWELAVPFLERAVAVDPEFGMAFRSLRTAYGQMGVPEKAREAMLKAYELRDRVSERERLHILATYHYSNQERSKAIDTYKKLLEIYPEDSMANNALGRFYSIQEEFEKAVERYTVPINKKADSVFLYDGLAFTYCGLGEYGKALEVLDQYLRDISDNSYIRLRISQIYFIEGKYELALREADKSHEMNPDRNSIELKGEIYQTMGNLEQAEKIFQGLAESRDRLPRLWGLISLAELYYQQRRFPETQEQLELGIKLAEEIGLKNWKTELHIRLGFLFLRWGKPQRTLEESTNAGRTYMSSHLRGLAYSNLNQVKSAQEEASELLSLLEKETNTNLIRHYYHLLGMIEHKKGNISRALEHFEAAVALLPFQRPLTKVIHPLFLEPLAEAYYATGDLDKAQSVYERITNLTEERLVLSNIYVKAFYNLGKIYEQQGNRAKAIEHYEKFLEIWKDADPGVPEVEDAKKRLAK